MKSLPYPYSALYAIPLEGSVVVAAQRDPRRLAITIVRLVAVLALAASATLVLGSTAWARRRPPTTTTTSPTSTTTTSTTTTTLPSTPPPTVGGYDISWPQCSQSLPAKPAFGIVGTSNGLAFSDNPCLAQEYSWAFAASRSPALYMSTADPGSQSVHWNTPSPKPCSGASTDLGCAYNYGWNAASHAFTYATSQHAVATMWWLDIETANTWSTYLAANNADIQGMIDYLHSQSVTVGVYSTAYQWGQITGSATLAIPNWVAGATSASQAASWCTPSRSFTGDTVSMVQYPAGSYDGDVAC